MALSPQLVFKELLQDESFDQWLKENGHGSAMLICSWGTPVTVLKIRRRYLAAIGEKETLLSGYDSAYLQELEKMVIEEERKESRKVFKRW